MSDPAEHEKQIAGAIHEAGWRTGSACMPESLDKHRDWMPKHVQQYFDGLEGLWVPFVISQACDLVHGSLSDEPHVEFILGRLDVQENPSIAPSKSYRRIQVRHPSKRFVEFLVHNRWNAPRAALLTLSPAPEMDLTWSAGIELARWIGSRYSRYPLPNTLAVRMEYKSGPQREWLKKLTAEVEEMRIVVTPPDRELEPNENYNIVLHVITRRALSAKASQAFDKFKNWMVGLPGITAQVRLESTDTFSHANFKATHRLDLDALTYGYLDGPKGLPPAID
jgi:hypothetical protein